MTAQGMHVRGSLLKQLRTAGFDKRPTSVDAIPCGDGRISSLHCAVVCIIITNVTALSWPVVAVIAARIHALLEHRSMMYCTTRYHVSYCYDGVSYTVLPLDTKARHRPRRIVLRARTQRNGGLCKSACTDRRVLQNLLYRMCLEHSP